MPFFTNFRSSFHDLRKNMKLDKHRHSVRERRVSFQWTSATSTSLERMSTINNLSVAARSNGSLIPASMKTIYFGELPSRQYRSRCTRGIMIQAPGFLQNGRKIDVRSERWRRSAEGIFLSASSFPFGSMIRTSKIDDDRRYTRWSRVSEPNGSCQPVNSLHLQGDTTRYDVTSQGREPGRKATLSLGSLCRVL